MKMNREQMAPALETEKEEMKAHDAQEAGRIKDLSKLTGLRASELEDFEKWGKEFGLNQKPEAFWRNLDPLEAAEQMKEEEAFMGLGAQERSRILSEYARIRSELVKKRDAVKEAGIRPVQEKLDKLLGA